MEFLQWLVSHWVQVVVAILGVAEIISLFFPLNGTVKGIISALAGIPGVKDPKIGQ